MSNESKLKAALALRIRKHLPNAKVFCHEDMLTHGIPDISITYANRVVWLELKHVTDTKPFKSSGIQLVTCLQLAHAATCWYIIYDEIQNRTLITHPQQIKTGQWRDHRTSFLGFDHDSVAQFIEERLNP